MAVHVAFHGDGYPFAEPGHIDPVTIPLHIIENTSPADVLIFWGGGDVHPSLYNERINGSVVDLVPTHRDTMEMALIQAAIKKKLFIIGICRGAHLVCAAAGGKVIQHTTGHCEPHAIKTREGSLIRANSVHHQMMYPWNVEHELYAWADEPRSNVYQGITDEERANVIDEPEIVYFPKIGGLAIQGHPEWLPARHPYVRYCFDLHRALRISHRATLKI